MSKQYLPLDFPLLRSYHLMHALEGPARGVVLLLHGRTGNGVDMIPLGRRIAGVCPYLDILIPDAPYLCVVPESPLGKSPPYQREWYDLSLDAREDVQVKQCSLSVEGLCALLKMHVSASSAALPIVICGYSQGSSMALLLGLRKTPGVRRVVGYAGRMVFHDGYEAVAGSLPTFHLLQGGWDGIVKPTEHTRAIGLLSAFGAEVTAEFFPDVTHDLVDEVQDAIVRQVKHAFSRTNDSGG